jgi:hypothetical protein
MCGGKKNDTHPLGWFVVVGDWLNKKGVYLGVQGRVHNAAQLRGMSMDCCVADASVPAATQCYACTVRQFELGLVRGDLKVKTEELVILRASQHECARMASDIQALHLLVDEQRRHMAAAGNSKGECMDANVGVFTWLDELSHNQRVQTEEIKARYEKQVAALHVTHAQHFGGLQLQLQTVTAQYYELLDRAQAESAMTATYAAQVQMLEATVKEQRRHLAASGRCDPDIALMPLIRKGYFESSEEMARMVAAATQTLNDSNAADAVAFDRVRDALSCSLDYAKEELKTEQVRCQLLHEEGLTLSEQVRKSRDFVAEWKRKYEDQRQENELLLMANEVRVDEDSLAQQFADMVAEKVEWEHLKQQLEKTKDAAIGGVRHWQQEAGKITNDLVTALASRDAFQLQLYTVSVSKQALEDEMETLKQTVSEQSEACELMKQVVALSEKYRVPKAGPVGITTDALEVLLLAEEAEAGKSKSQKAKKKRGKK